MGCNDIRKRENVYFHIPWQYILAVVISLPLCGFLLCVLLSLAFHFEGTTRTHCKVPNYLPSISAAIGDFRPEVYIWRICIALHCAPRFMFAVIYYNFHTSYHVRKFTLFKVLAAAASSLHVVENFSLVGLTYISSSENYDLHENCFILFMVCSLVYMLLTCILFQWEKTEFSMSATVLRSLKYKRLLFVTNLGSFLLAVYFFFRHSQYCEPGVYTIFSFLEYITVTTNILFHGTIVLDLEGYALVVGPVEKFKSKS
ncbi:post-GPI attachment to proteins factor 2-like [Liolophura sinensis]|uniref:post-GPI attachment to proteins factor 2-like n=1 Tax=Liolophura sinensis TaxID=3198878 RepID=UPI003157F711